MANRASGAGGAVGAGGSADFFLVCAEASRPRSAPAAARVPIILRRGGVAVGSIADGIGSEESMGLMGGIAAPFRVMQQRCSRRRFNIAGRCWRSGSFESHCGSLDSLRSLGMTAEV